MMMRPKRLVAQVSEKSERARCWPPVEWRRPSSPGAPAGLAMFLEKRLSAFEASEADLGISGPAGDI